MKNLHLRADLFMGGQCCFSMDYVYSCMEGMHGSKCMEAVHSSKLVQTGLVMVQSAWKLSMSQNWGF